MQPLFAYAVIGVAVVSLLAWMDVARRRDEREVAESAAESTARTERRAAELRADSGRQDRAVVAAAEFFCAQAVADGNVQLMGDLALLYPMPKRPAPPAPAPGEPWQLPTLTDMPGLVGPGDSDD